MECPCPCHRPGNSCSVNARRREDEMKGGDSNDAMMDPLEIHDVAWKKAFFEAKIELMAEKIQRLQARLNAATPDKAVDATIEKWKNNRELIVVNIFLLTNELIIT